MGLIEQIKSGSRFTRQTITINANTPPSSTGAIDMGATFILLKAASSAPCRIRLYGTTGSMQIDLPRPSSSFDFSASVALTLDAAFTSSNSSIQFIPPIIGTTYIPLLNTSTWYNVESATATDVSLDYYPIEFNTASRETLNIPINVGVNLSGNETSSGNFDSPKSFLIYGALSDTTNTRIRLYSRPIEEVPSWEKNRAFVTQSATGSYIITDMLFDSASYLYKISPVIQAYNLETYLSGSNRVGYILENLSASPQTGVFASLLVYPLEN